MRPTHTKEACKAHERLVARARELQGATLVVRKDGFAPFESTWSLANKITYLNALPPRAVEALLATDKALNRIGYLLAPGSLNDSTALSPEKLAAALKIPSHWARYAFGDALTPPATRPAEMLRFCESCARQGFHSAAFQALPFERCPLHDEHIRESCPECGDPILLQFGPRYLEKPWCCARCGYELWPDIQEPRWNTLPPSVIASTFWPVRWWVLQLRRHDSSKVWHDIEPGTARYDKMPYQRHVVHRQDPFSAVDGYRLWASLEPAPEAIAPFLPRVAMAGRRVHLLPGRPARRHRPRASTQHASHPPSEIDLVEARTLAAVFSVQKRIRGRFVKLLQQHWDCVARRPRLGFDCDAVDALSIWQYYWDSTDQPRRTMTLLESNVRRLLQHLRLMDVPGCDIGNLALRIIATDLIESFWDVAHFLQLSREARNYFNFDSACMVFLRQRRPALLLTVPAGALVETRMAYIENRFEKVASSFACKRAAAEARDVAARADRIAAMTGAFRARWRRPHQSRRSKTPEQHDS